MRKLKEFWSTKKKWILGSTAAVFAAAAGCGAWYQVGHSNAEPVYVYPFQYVGMTEYWGDSQESYGPVSSDNIQTVFLSDTQTVTEILVSQGDEVKKGDLLMTFDTTLSDLQLERKRLGVETLKLQVEDAEEELGRINSMKPMVIQTATDAETDQGILVPERRLYPEIDGTGIVNGAIYDGSSPERALICWLWDGKEIDSSTFLALDELAATLQERNKPEEPVPDPSEGGGETPDPSEGGGETPDPSEGGGETPDPSEGGGETPDPSEGSGETPDPSEGGGEPPDPGEGGEEIPSSASESAYFELEVGASFYAVLKSTQNNMSLGGKTVWQCLKVTKRAVASYSFAFVDTVISDYSMPSTVEVEAPEPEPDSGYTAAQIAQLRSDQKKKIAGLEFQVKMAEAEYKITLKEISDGNIYAENDGKVVSLLTEEEARRSRQPILKVSGGGGFYVEGFVSELEKENMKIGQEVTVNDWNTGMVYTGYVHSIGDFPTRDGYWNGSGNPNASNYPFQVFVDETADLQAGSYVSIQYSSAESRNGVYLENPFLRTEQGRTYVLVLGAEGTLEQRWVTTGKSLWGSYTEVLANLTAEDLVAFPYGKNVKPGVAAQEGDLSSLYG